VKTNLTAYELAGFGVVVIAFIALFAMLGLDGQSWGAIALLALFLLLLVAYRTWLKRRHA
jgi:hypothetical protein